MGKHAARPGAQPIGRRQLLRYGALAAATAAGTAGTAALAQSASAAPGDPVTVDQVREGAAGVTELRNSQFLINSQSRAPLSIVERASDPLVETGWVVGDIVSYQGLMLQCIAVEGDVSTWRELGPFDGLSLRMLDQPFRVYGSTSTPSKIGYNQTRKVSVLQNLQNVPSGVPPWATAVLGTVQLQYTETNLGWLAIASGDVTPAGFSTVVWSSANFAGVNSFTSRIGVNGDLSVRCLGPSTAVKTHFFIDIVGWYESPFWSGFPASAETVAGVTKAGGDTVLRRGLPTRR